MKNPLLASFKTPHQSTPFGEIKPEHFIPAIKKDIQESLKNSKVKITRLAQGLPVGGEIENLDDGTLISAFKNRSNLISNSD